MRKWIKLVENNTIWDLGGCWITDTGNILECDHAHDIHHSDLALSEFGDFIELNDEGEYDDYSRDYAIDLAYDDGWIRISTKGLRSFSVEWRTKPNKEALRALKYILDNDKNTYNFYELETPNNNFIQVNDLKRFKRALNTVLSKSLNELYAGGFSFNRYGKNLNCEVFKNPTPKEYMECLNGNENVRAFLIGKNILIWNTYSALHQEVREKMQLETTAIPILLYGNLGRDCLVQVTDNSANTIWWHNPEIVRFIENHQFLNRAFSNIDEISFYDEAIYGKWNELEENIVEDCRTPGAIFDTKITDNTIQVTVKLPPEVKIPDMTEKQGEGLDDELHDSLEKIIADLIDDLDSDADEHWANARKNDKIEESIVHKDRFLQADNDILTVIAVNPSKREWLANFPTGAAGVLCKNGTIVVGNGNCLDHSSILSYAHIPPEQEDYRLQIYPNRAFVELWLDDEEEFNGKPLTNDEIKALCVETYGETIEQIEAKLIKAIHKFMPGSPCRVIPLNNDQECMRPEDEIFQNYNS